MKTGQLPARQREPRFPIVATVRCCLTGLGLWQFVEQEEQKNLRGACVFVPQEGIKMAAAHVKYSSIGGPKLFHFNGSDDEKEMASGHKGSHKPQFSSSRAADCCRTPFFSQFQAVDVSQGIISANRHRLPSASWMNTPLSSPSADKIRSQCPQGPRGRSYIIKYTEGGVG